MHLDNDPIVCITIVLVAAANIWYVSDNGLDNNDCHSASAPCQNLQTVLDNAKDGADIYVMSDTLSLDAVYKKTWNWLAKQMQRGCVINSSLSYNLHSLSDNLVNVTCSG